MTGRVRRDFSTEEANIVLDLLDELGDLGEEPDDAGRERVHAAIVLLARGNSLRFLDAAALATRDWRDVLVAAGLADEDWRERLVEALGP